MSKVMQDLLKKYIDNVKKIYGSHLKQIILYGSYARGDFTSDSDVDIMLLVDLPEDVDSVMYAGSGSTAEEVGVFTAKDSNQAKETMEDVQKYLDDQADSFQDYVPEETKRIGNAVLEQKNQYVVLCVSGDSDQAKEIIEKAFK